MLGDNIYRACVEEDFTRASNVGIISTDRHLSPSTPEGNNTASYSLSNGAII